MLGVRPMRFAHTALLAASPLLLEACYLWHAPSRDAGEDGGRDATVGEPDAGAPDGGVDAPFDANVDGGGECDAGPVVLDGGGGPISVDMLFVVDNSGSMSEEQEALARQFPRLVRLLVTGDLDEDGRAEFEPVTDLRVGVVTTELDIGRTDIPGCRVSLADGDDGALRTHGYFWRDECVRNYPRFLDYAPGSGESPDRFVQELACKALVGNDGCGFEQPLEAALKALTASTSSIEFATGTGRADLDNAGFVRDGSILAVVLVTDEDDCSAADLELFDEASERYPRIDGPAQNLRCFYYPDALQPVDCFIEALAEVRADDPDSFLFAAITGVPPDLVEDPNDIDYDALLADPRMQRRVDASRPERLVAACDVVGVGYAEPARRIVEVARGLARVSTVQSICDDTFNRALAGITSKLGRVIRRRRCM